MYENIELASEIQSSKANFKSRMGQILDWLGLENIANNKVDKLLMVKNKSCYCKSINQ